MLGHADIAFGFSIWCLCRILRLAIFKFRFGIRFGFRHRAAPNGANRVFVFVAINMSLLPELEFGRVAILGRPSHLAGLRSRICARMLMESTELVPVRSRGRSAWHRRHCYQ